MLDGKEMLHHYDSVSDATSVGLGSGIYAKGDPEDITGYSWYHGNITEEQATLALSMGNYNKFLIRHSDTDLVLSMRINGWKSHLIIHRSPEGYRLDKKDKIFHTVLALISYYKQFPVDEGRRKVLGTPIDRQSAGMT